MALEIGRVCMKTAGREAGRYCVVLKKKGVKKSSN
jgi:ribosomal protein L14E/L6E/L27E